MFIETDHHHWRNRRDAHLALAEPALLTTGAPAVRLRIGKVFVVLSEEEFANIADRVHEAFNPSEPFKSRFFAIAEKHDNA